MSVKATRGNSNPPLEVSVFRKSKTAPVAGLSVAEPPINTCAFTLAALNIVSASIKNIIFRMF
jgi:hypothetical protein